MRQEQIDAITRNFEKFCKASGIPSGVLIFHGKYGEDHAVLQNAPGICKLVDEIHNGIKKIIDEHKDDRPFDFKMN